MITVVPSANGSIISIRPDDMGFEQAVRQLIDNEIVISDEDF